MAGGLNGAACLVDWQGGFGARVCRGASVVVSEGGGGGAALGAGESFIVTSLDEVISMGRGTPVGTRPLFTTLPLPRPMLITSDSGVVGGRGGVATAARTSGVGGESPRGLVFCLHRRQRRP